MSSPDLGTDGYFIAISCSSPTSCVATGLLINGGDDFSSLAESWDGVSWTVTPTQNPGTDLTELISVSCTSSTNCVAVGAYHAGPHVKIRTLVETWDGTDWSITPTPDTDASLNELYGTSCFDDSSCVAVGYSYNGALILAGS